LFNKKLGQGIITFLKGSSMSNKRNENLHNNDNSNICKGSLTFDNKFLICKEEHKFCKDKISYGDYYICKKEYTPNFLQKFKEKR
jgi:hypothetical protein